MKRFLIYMVLLTAGIFSGCEKEDEPIFDDPDTRLAAELAADQAKLVGGTNGWKATIYPAGGKGFFFYFKFTADGKVKMLSDFNVETATTVSESTYRIKALQRPTLIFDTYNYIHLPADPNSAVSGGTNAVGLRSDFEFAFTEAIQDTLKFEGVYNKNTMHLVKLTSAEEQSIINGGIKNIINDGTTAVSGKILFLGIDSKQVPISISLTGKSISIAGQSSTNFSYALDGLELKSKVTYGNLSFDKVYWDAAGKFFYFQNGNSKLNIQISLAPLPLETSPALHTVLGTRWAAMQINVANLPDLSADFMQAYNAANAGLGTYQNAGRYIEYITLLFNSNGTVTFQIRYRNPASPSSFFNADFIHNVTLDPVTGIAKFTLAAAPAGNANTIRTYVTALTNYFINNNFKIAYIAAAAPAGATVGGFLSQDNPASFFYGVLQQ